MRPAVMFHLQEKLGQRAEKTLPHSRTNKASNELKLNHHPDAGLGLTSAQIRKPNTTGVATCRGCGVWIGCSGRGARVTHVILRRAVRSAQRETGRRDAAAPRKIWDIGVTIANLRPPCNVLLGHVLEGNRAIPHVRLLAGKLREVRRARHSVRPVDGRQQCQIAAVVAHLAAAKRYRVMVLAPPVAVVEHPTYERFFALARRAGTAQSASVLGARVTGEGHGDLGEASTVRVVIETDLDTIVRVNTFGVRKAQVVLSEAVLVGDELEPFFRHPE